MSESAEDYSSSVATSHYEKGGTSPEMEMVLRTISDYSSPGRAHGLARSCQFDLRLGLRAGPALPRLPVINTPQQIVKAPSRPELGIQETSL